MQLEIKSHVGVGPIKFGMTRNEVRTALAREPKVFLKGLGSVTPTDSFDDLGLHVYYNESDVCEAIEMFLTADARFEGHPLIERPFNRILTWFQAMDNSIEIDNSGLTSLELGIALYAPGIREHPDAPIEAVFVFELGYYD